ncbi:RluA family pseudouridine synthase [Enterovirga aerilata]|uniref:Pseudouridine synthase n=1 Tax=Enterovirga aerilata TaxID=2730920 RepID=A0A849IDF7_9HYPH|nr:RluA family pseudouridine synthase [Enterovirga sp. DB1703]NNM74017.1 RluA family pseudouridine synthase [Enterovirga sp. DB1703]
MTTRIHQLAPGAPAQRLDRLLASAWPDLSRSRLQALIRGGHVTLAGQPVRDPSLKAAGSAEIALAEPPPAPAEPVPERIPLQVVYEDEDLVVLDKPAGLVVHPGAGNESGTLVNALLAHCGASLSGIGGVARPGIVHRLDKDTSGLLVAAKNDAAHRALAAQFADHGRTGPLERAYLAFCWGAPEPRRGTIEAAIARHNSNREKMAVVPEEKGRHAVTHYAVEELFGDPADPAASLVRCELETGRTHQIRVHLAFVKHPLLGDEVYGAGFRTKAALLPEQAGSALAALQRQALHAALLQFEHPRTGRIMRFESPLPPELEKLRAALRMCAPAHRPERKLSS